MPSIWYRSGSISVWPTVDREVQTPDGESNLQTNLRLPRLKLTVRVRLPMIIKLTERVRLPTVVMLTVICYTYRTHWRLRYQQMWSIGDTSIIISGFLLRFHFFFFSFNNHSALRTIIISSWKVDRMSVCLSMYMIHWWNQYVTLHIIMWTVQVYASVIYVSSWKLSIHWVSNWPQQ
jgi:hypothetical protein